MLTEYQHTIAEESTCEGRGLFMGEPVKVRFKPAPVNHGIVFVRTDLQEAGQPVRIPALVSNVTRRQRRTTLRRGAVAIETTEHCMSALAGLGIDNAVVEVDGPELPGGDGSANVFIEAILEAKPVAQDSPRRIVKVNEPITVHDGDAMLAALPSEQPVMQIIYDLDYGEGSPIPRQVTTVNLDPESYLKNIAPARTFVLESEVKLLQAGGMGAHLTEKDLLVIGNNGPLGNEMRFSNEPSRHKTLDLIGDLALLGARIHGRIVAYKSGHALNHQLARRLATALVAEERRDLLRRDGELDVRHIQRILPHRYPMLLIDRILEMDGGQRAVGLKNVTINEPFFQGHYPGTPVMPGVLLVEAMAQLSGILMGRKLEHTGKIGVILSMDKVKLRRPVVPGDQLVIEAEAVRIKSRTGHTRCRIYVGSQPAAEAQIKFMLVDAEQD